MSAPAEPWFEHFFLHSDTLDYEQDDQKKFSTSTPIPFQDLPKCLFSATTVPGFDPPTFWCGWRIGRNGLYKLVQEHYKEQINEADYTDGTFKFYRDMTMMKLPALVWKELNVFVKCSTVGDENGDEVDPATMAFAVANNREIPPDRNAIERVKNKFFKSEPQWYLDLNKFHWSQLEVDGSPQGNLDDLKEEHQKVRSERIMAAQVPSAA